MGKPFYRGTDAQLATGSTAFLAIVTPVPATYGLSASQVTSYTALSTSYNSLLALAVGPSTRTPVAISNKNVARKNLVASSVNLARIITATPTVTNAQLIALGLNERLIPQPRPVPDSAPVVEFVSCNGRLVNIRLHGAAPDSTRGKPFGAIGANVFSFVGDEAPTDPKAYHFEGLATRPKVQIQFPDTVASGATIWISACWVSARGQIGIGSVPISFTIQGGAIPVSA